MSKTMQLVKGHTFKGFDDRDSAAIIGDIEFRKCSFDSCLVSITGDPMLRTTIQNVALVECAENGGSIGTAIVKDVLVENVKTVGLFQTFGAVFNRVVLRGRIDRLMISNDDLPDLSLNQPYQYENVKRFRVANKQFYRDVEWALDVSQGEFKELDIRGIPSRLIRRDPETQVVVKRERLLAADDWRELRFNAAPCQIGFQLLLHGEDEDTIVVAPKRHRRFHEFMDDLKLLRDAGVACED